MKITIPANQQAEPGQNISVIIGSGELAYPIQALLTNDTDSPTSTASYNTVFDSTEFDPYVHGFRGINASLMHLCNSLK